MYILLLNAKLALFRPCCCKILYTYILNSYNGIDNFPQQFYLLILIRPNSTNNIQKPPPKEK